MDLWAPTCPKCRRQVFTLFHKLGITKRIHELGFGMKSGFIQFDIRSRGGILTLLNLLKIVLVQLMSAMQSPSSLPSLIRLAPPLGQDPLNPGTDVLPFCAEIIVDRQRSFNIALDTSKRILPDCISSFGLSTIFFNSLSHLSKNVTSSEE